MQETKTILPNVELLRLAIKAYSRDNSSKNWFKLSSIVHENCVKDFKTDKYESLLGIASHLLSMK